jgi:predicted nuclease of predicted toxin-antitoxin system
MRFKVDENLHEDVAAALRGRGHDVHTIPGEQLRGSPDSTVIDVCRIEQRIPITCDLGFSDLDRMSSSGVPAVIIFRLVSQSRRNILRVLELVLNLLPVEPLIGAIWIAEETRVRVRPFRATEN